jgi:AcrR family transcriptional regulator
MSPRKPEDNQEILDQRRTEILEAALKVFAHRGLAGTKVGDIAATAGLSHGLLYHYFRSKEEIFTELVRIAYQVSLGTITAAAELPGTAWEKIKAMTEMIFSGAYRGDGPYYFLITLQAFTSEAVVPEEVKKMTAENSNRYMEILVPLLEKAMKAGDIAPGDPVQLAATYFSLIQGLAIMRVQAGESLPPPDPGIVLRLLQGPVGKKEENGEKTPGSGSNQKGEPQDKSESQAGAGAEPVFGPVKLKKEKLFYRAKKRAGREYTTHSTLLTETGDSYHMEKVEEDGARTIAITEKANWRPQLVQKFTAAGEKVTEITYGEGWVQFDLKEEGIRRRVNLSGEYYDFSTLAFLLRAYPFGRKEKITFRLVMDGSGGSPQNAVVMYLQVVKQEEVTVPAGTFDCFKLEMGIGGMAGIFAAKYRYYFWYPVTEPRFLVKYESADGDLVELTGEEPFSGISP